MDIRFSRGTIIWHAVSFRQYTVVEEPRPFALMVGVREPYYVYRRMDDDKTGHILWAQAQSEVEDGRFTTKNPNLTHE